jgi:hypothetical protein
MGSSKLKKIDKNRWRKTYPRFRKLPVTSYMGDAELVIETHEVTFTKTSEVIFHLKEQYRSAPSITATAFGSGTGEDSADVNIWIAKVEVGGVPPGGRRVAVTIRASVEWTGKVLVQAIKAG